MADSYYQVSRVVYFPQDQNTRKCALEALRGLEVKNEKYSKTDNNRLLQICTQKSFKRTIANVYPGMLKSEAYRIPFEVQVFPLCANDLMIGPKDQPVDLASEMAIADAVILPLPASPTERDYAELRGRFRSAERAAEDVRRILIAQTKNPEKAAIAIRGKFSKLEVSGNAVEFDFISAPTLHEAFKVALVDVFDSAIIQQMKNSLLPEEYSDYVPLISLG